MSKEVSRIIGMSYLKSNLTIEEVGNILSEKLFAGFPFGGKEENIYEEIPAIFIRVPILGLRIVLQGKSGIDENSGFALEILPWISFDKQVDKDILLDDYLTQILKLLLKDRDDIIVIE